MQITETVNQELRREYKVVIPQGDLEQKLTGRIEEMKPRMQLKGFRPGKAPTSHLKKTFGKQIMGEIVEAAVNESSQKTITDNALKPGIPTARRTRRRAAGSGRRKVPISNSRSRST